MTVIVSAVGLMTASRLSVAQNRVIAPGARVESLAGGFAFAQEPTCDPEGNRFFTDQPNTRTLKWSVEGKFSTFLQPAGRLIACADETTALWSTEPNGSRQLLREEHTHARRHGTHGFVRGQGAPDGVDAAKQPSGRDSELWHFKGDGDRLSSRMGPGSA